MMLGIIADGQMPSVLREAFQESLVPFFCCKENNSPQTTKGVRGKDLTIVIPQSSKKRFMWESHYQSISTK